MVASINFYYNVFIDVSADNKFLIRKILIGISKIIALIMEKSLILAMINEHV